MIIDTECHVIDRLWPIEINPSRSLVEGYTWHSHSGDLLVAEMDRAGVSSAFLIGYDGYDFPAYLARFGSGPDEFFGGRTYARHYVDKHPQRFSYFVTLRDPRTGDRVEELTAEAERGAAGIKIFPSYLALALDDPAMKPVYECCAAHNLRIMVGLEDTAPPRTNSPLEYFQQLERMLDQHPTLLWQFNHAGAVDLPSREGDAFFRIAKESRRVYVSTSFLGGGADLAWPDQWRYPFPQYLQQLEVVYDAIGADRLMWATDWPWLESFTKYPQLLGSIQEYGTFMSSAERDAFLGLNAVAFLAGRTPG
jgi:predicted TIM-barrel fold metal-dependent hydrolase